MKYLLILLLMLFFLQSCTEKKLIKEFKVGECVQTDILREKWEGQPLIYKVKYIGEESYGVYYCEDENVREVDPCHFFEHGYPPISTWRFDFAHYNFNKVPCPRNTE